MRSSTDRQKRGRETLKAEKERNKVRERQRNGQKESL